MFIWRDQDIPVHVSVYIAGKWKYGESLRVHNQEAVISGHDEYLGG